MENKEHLYTGTQDIVCPHCLVSDTDSWEWRLGDGQEVQIDCENCGKPFTVTAEIMITYTSTIKE